MSAELANFTTHCDRISELIKGLPTREEREELRTLIEELVMKMSGPWFAHSLAWVGEVPDTIEGIEQV